MAKEDKPGGKEVRAPREILKDGKNVTQSLSPRKELTCPGDCGKLVVVYKLDLAPSHLYIRF